MMQPNNRGSLPFKKATAKPAHCLANKRLEALLNSRLVLQLRAWWKTHSSAILSEGADGFIAVRTIGAPNVSVTHQRQTDMVRVRTQPYLTRLMGGRNFLSEVIITQ